MSVYPSINITYHRQNTFCNSIGALIVAVTYAVILFHLSGIYRQSSSVGNPISNSDICSNSFFNPLEYTDRVVLLVTPSVIF